jgi:hypothetical protein
MWAHKSAQLSLAIECSCWPRLCSSFIMRWLRNCATSRKVAGSIPDGVTGIFHWQNPSGRTMALGLTQPLTEMSTWNNLTTFMCRLSWNLGASTSWNLMGLSRPVMGSLYSTWQIGTTAVLKTAINKIVPAPVGAPDQCKDPLHHPYRERQYFNCPLTTDLGPCHGAGGLSPAAHRGGLSLFPDQSIGGLWLTKWHRNTFLSECSGFSSPFCFIQSNIHIFFLSITDVT